MWRKVEENKNIKSRSRIIEEASAWVVKLNGGRLSREDSLAFEDWLNESDAHKQAFKQLAQVWSGVGRAFEVRPTQDGAQMSIRRIISAWAQVYPAKAWSVGIAACLALVICAGLVGNALLLKPQSKLDLVVAQTRVGESKTIAMSDGSIIQLNTDTEVNVAYSEGERAVKLLKGEAFFRVAKNANRPFRVYAGNGSVEAVGTAFGVYLRNNATEVTVTEGQVKLSRLETAAKPGTSRLPEREDTIATAVAGRNVVFDKSLISFEEINKEEMAKKLSWQEGRLLFNGDTLEKAVGEFERYTSADIVILDNDIRNTRIIGSFSSGDLEKFLYALETSFDIVARPAGKDKIYLYHKENQGQRQKA